MTEILNSPYKAVQNMLNISMMPGKSLGNRGFQCRSKVVKRGTESKQLLFREVYRC